MPKYDIHYESRELARELGDPLLGTVEAVRKAEHDPQIRRKAMPCAAPGPSAPASVATTSGEGSSRAGPSLRYCPRKGDDRDDRLGTQPVGR